MADIPGPNTHRTRRAPREQGETVAHVVGARPNFMKAAPVIRALAARGVAQRLVHTGQHYDDAMSDVFFRDLGLPEPDVNLGVGSGTQAGQTAALMVALERAFAEIRPALVVVYGDVNSTMAAALVAAKLGLPLAHVEAGLRSFDDTMPEEINRRVTDLLSELLFVTSPEGVDNLVATGTPAERIHFVGNPMIDTLLAQPRPVRRRADARRRSTSPSATRWRRCTGRPTWTTRARRRGSRRCCAAWATACRWWCRSTRAAGRRWRRPASRRRRLRSWSRSGYVDFLSLVRGAALVVTDSGGIQEETTVLGVPCLTVRPNTERPITITHGTNRLRGARGRRAVRRAILAGDVAVPPRDRRCGTATPASGSRRDRDVARGAGPA